MKKILLFTLILILIGVGLFFWFNKEKGLNLLNNEADFGKFFDIDSQSNNNFIETSTSTTNQPTPNLDQPYQAPILRQISFEPVSGFTFYATSSTSTIIKKDIDNKETIEEIVSTSTTIRFQERATGHIYDVFEFMLAPQIISNNTIPKIYQTIFISKNDFIYKTLSSDNEQIISKKGTLITSTTTDPINQEVVLETKISSLDLSSFISDIIYNQNKLVYSIKQNITTSIFTSNTDRTNEKVIKTLPLNDFLLDKINQNEVLITTKPSRDSVGYSYILNLNTGLFSKILGDIQGLLVTVSPSKDFYIYTQSEQTRPIARVFNSKTNTTQPIILDTLPEKCVFSQTNTTIAYCFGSLVYKSAKYPDDWYKGKIFNKEDLYIVNLESGDSTPVFYLQQESGLLGEFDVINPSITPKDTHIIFQNKKDLTLWSIDLTQINQVLF